MTTKEIIQVLEAIIGREKADGCVGCAFRGRDEWEMPCSRCKRNCNDYWRAAEAKDE